MNQESIIEVINRDGWRKDYPLQKGIVYIGSAPTNDIVLNGLNGGGVAPLHVQLIANQTGYKLINLGDSEIVLGDGGQMVPPRAVMDLNDGQQFRLGEFTLIFRGGGIGADYGGMATHREGVGAIGLNVALPHNRLAPHQSLEGRVRVQNLGGKTGVRFDIDLEGMDEECYDIAPGPLLSSGAERDVLFRIHHRGLKPLAGDWYITFRATAPNDYPGEEAVISEYIQVLPFYRHRLHLLPPGSDPSPLTEEDFLMPKAKGDLPSPERGANSARSTANDWWTASPPAPEKSQAVRMQARQPVSPPAEAASPSPSTPAEPEESWEWTTTEPHEEDDDQPVIIEAEGGDWGWDSDEEAEVTVAHSSLDTAAETAVDDNKEPDKKKDTVEEAEPTVAPPEPVEPVSAAPEPIPVAAQEEAPAQQIESPAPAETAEVIPQKQVVQPEVIEEAVAEDTIDQPPVPEPEADLPSPDETVGSEAQEDEASPGSWWQRFVQAIPFRRTKEEPEEPGITPEEEPSVSQREAVASVSGSEPLPAPVEEPVGESPQEAVGEPNEVAEPTPDEVELSPDSDLTSPHPVVEESFVPTPQMESSAEVESQPSIAVDETTDLETQPVSSRGGGGL